MKFALIALFGLIAALAAAFVAWPVFARTTGRARLLFTTSVALFVAGIGIATYLELGRPALAVRGLAGRDANDLNGAIALAVRHLHAAPNDLGAWKVLGQAYLDAGDGDDALKAFVRAISVSRALGRPDAQAYADYGMALVAVSGDTVPQEAERAFRLALSLDPANRLALFFMGQASAARGRNGEAIAFWERLLGEMPANSPFRQKLVDAIAQLKAASGAAPDIAAMVASLAARLKTQPDDPLGWQRLVRAYAVLGDQTKAKAALADARAAMAKRPDALGALGAEAKELKLEK